MSNIVQWFTDLLILLYSYLGNMGLVIVVFTVLMRAVLLPLTLPALKAQKKLKELKPELDKLKKKHQDKKALQQAQLDLYKKYNVNPLAGCLPQLVQIGVLIVLYRSLLNFLDQPMLDGMAIDANFLWLNLTKPDPKYVLPVATATVQLILSVMISPGAEVRDVVPDKSQNKKTKAANKQEEDMAEMALTMQKQMIFMMPLMAGFFALRFPSGLALYWIVTTLFSIAQQWMISGPGGLVSYWQRAKAKVTS